MADKTATKMMRPAGLVNLNEKFPKYDPGIDARDKSNVGEKGNTIHGYLLGHVDLPKTIMDRETGEKKDWTAFVIQLISPCPVVYADSEGKTKKRVAGKGEKIILTETKALERFRPINGSPQVAEVWIEPMVDTTSDGQSLWLYPVFAAGNPIPRTADMHVGSPMLQGAPAPKALASVNGTPMDVPFG